MRLKDTFITHDSDGEQVLIDVTSSFAGLVRSNKTAAFIVECLKTDTTKEQIDTTVDAIKEIVAHLRSMSPLYEDFVKNQQ